MSLGVTCILFAVPRVDFIDERFLLPYSARKALTTSMAEKLF